MTDGEGNVLGRAARTAGGQPGHLNTPGGRCLYLLPCAFLLWAVGAGEELQLASSSTLHSSTMTWLGRTAAQEIQDIPQDINVHTVLIVSPFLSCLHDLLTLKNTL